MANVFPSVNSNGVFTNPTYNSPPLNQLLNQITSIKLDRSNFLLWKNLTHPILKSYRLFGHLIREKESPPMFVQPEATAVLSPLPATPAAPSYVTVTAQ